MENLMAPLKSMYHVIIMYYIMGLRVIICLGYGLIVSILDNDAGVRMAMDTNGVGDMHPAPHPCLEICLSFPFPSPQGSPFPVFCRDSNSHGYP